MQFELVLQQTARYACEGYGVRLGPTAAQPEARENFPLIPWRTAAVPVGLTWFCSTQGGAADLSRMQHLELLHADGEQG